MVVGSLCQSAEGSESLSARKSVTLTKLQLKVQTLTLLHFSAVQWAKLECLPGQFWSLDLMFDTPLMADLQLLDDDKLT